MDSVVSANLTSHGWWLPSQLVRVFKLHGSGSGSANREVDNDAVCVRELRGSVGLLRFVLRLKPLIKQQPSPITYVGVSALVDTNERNRCDYRHAALRDVVTYCRSLQQEHPGIRT